MIRTIKFPCANIFKDSKGNLENKYKLKERNIFLFYRSPNKTDYFLSDYLIK